MRSVVKVARNSPEDVCVLDTEASTEHLLVATARHADAMYAVVEPYYKSLETGRRIVMLAKDLGIPRVALIANKVRDAGELAAVEEFADSHSLELAGEVPYDDCFFGAERAALAPIDHSPEAPAVRAIGELARRLV